MTKEEYMAEKLRAPGFKAVEPNSVGLALSKALRAGKDALNWPGKLPQGVPLLGGMGAGDLILGQAPEAIEDYSYGIKKPWIAEQNRADPRLIDIAALPLVSGAIGKGLKSIPTAAPAVTDLSRREFMKAAGALGASTAAGGLVLKAALKELAPAVATQSGKAGISALTAGLLKGGEQWFTTKLPAWTKNVLMDAPGLSTEELGVFPSTMKFFGEHPDLEKALAKAVEGVNPKDVDPNFLAKMATRSGHSEFNMGELLPETVGGKFPDWKSPETLRQFEELIITGKLPKGAPAELQDLQLMDLPLESKLYDLLQVAFDAEKKALAHDKKIRPELYD